MTAIDPNSLPAILIDTAWHRHHKRNSWGGYQNVFQTILGMNLDWDKFERNHQAFCGYWDRHGWQYCAETLLGWVENGMCPPPPELSRGISLTSAERASALGADAGKAYIRD